MLKKLKKAAKDKGVAYYEFEMTRHTAIILGGVRSGLKRHNEIDDVTAGKFFDQFAQVLGRGWWR